MRSGPTVGPWLGGKLFVGDALGFDEGRDEGCIVGLLDGASEGAEAQRRTHDKARGERFVEKKKIARKYNT